MEKDENRTGLTPSAEAAEAKAPAQKQSWLRRTVDGSFSGMKQAFLTLLPPWLVCVAIVLCVICGGRDFAGFEAMLNGEPLFQSLWSLFAMTFFLAALFGKRKVSPALRIPGYVVALAVAGVWYFLSAAETPILPDQADVSRILLNAALLLGSGWLLLRGENFSERLIRLALHGTICSILLNVFLSGIVAVAGVMTALLGIGDSFLNITAYAAAILYGAVLPVTLMPALLPEGETPPCPKWLRAFVTFGLLPLMGILTAVFYIYLARILVTGTWPSNEVAPIVLGASIAALAGMVFFRGVPESPVGRWYCRLLPAVWLLPLGMLFAAVLIRMDHYGLTPMRLFVLLTALWILAMLILLALRREKVKPALLPLTYALVLAFAAATLFPLSTAAQIALLDRELDRAGMGSHDRITAPAQPLSEKARTRICAAADYLEEHTDVVIRTMDGTDFDGSNYREVFRFGETDAYDFSAQEEWTEENTLSFFSGQTAYDCTDACWLIPDVNFFDGCAGSCYGNEQAELIVQENFTFTVETAAGSGCFDVGEMLIRAAETQDGSPVTMENGGIALRIIPTYCWGERDDLTGEITLTDGTVTVILLDR